MPERSSTDDECVDELVVCGVSPRGRCVRGRCVEDCPGFSEAFTGFSVADVLLGEREGLWAEEDPEPHRRHGCLYRGRIAERRPCDVRYSRGYLARVG